MNKSLLHSLPKKIRQYFGLKFQADLYAGLTVGMIAIPQAMAYAAVVGINPIYGLFTAIIPTIIGSLFGSFPFLITGPTNPTALVTASVLLSFQSRPDYLEYVIALAVIAGIMKLIFGLLKLGVLSKYISNSVLVGFLSGVGILIISTQAGKLLGFKLPSQGNLFEVFSSFWESIININIYAAIVGGLSIAVMLIIRKVNRKWPAALITIAFATLFVYITGWANGESIDLVDLPDRLGMGFHLPQISFSELGPLLFSGIAVTLLGFMESISVTKSMSQITGSPINPSREMIGQGLASFVGGFFQCMPSAGSPSRTVINVVNGARTRISGVFSGVSVLIFLLLFSRFIRFIPIPALAAVIIVSSAGLINFNLIKVTWYSRLSSRVVMTVTFISTLILPLEYAIYLGILSSILIYLGESSHVNLSYIIENEDGHFLELPIEEIIQQDPKIAIINVDGDIYFAAVEELQEHVKQILETNIKVLILRFRRTHLLASTGVMAINDIIRAASKNKVHLLFCGITESMMEPLQTAGIVDHIGKSRFFQANYQLFDSTHQALKEARRLLEETTVEETPAKEIKG